MEHLAHGAGGNVDIQQTLQERMRLFQQRILCLLHLVLPSGIVGVVCTDMITRCACIVNRYMIARCRCLLSVCRYRAFHKKGYLGNCYVCRFYLISPFLLSFGIRFLSSQKTKVSLVILHIITFHSS